MTAERTPARDIEMPGLPTPLIEFLVLRPDEKIDVLGFTPLTGVRGNYRVEVRKIGINSSNEELELQLKKFPTDKELEEAKAWSVRAIYATLRKRGDEIVHEDGSKFTKEQILGMDRKVTAIDDFVIKSIIGFLSEGQAFVSAPPADDAGLITIERLSEGADGAKKLTTLVLTEAKMQEVKIEVNAQKQRKLTPVVDTEVLESNIASITKGQREFALSRQSAIAQ